MRTFAVLAALLLAVPLAAEDKAAEQGGGKKSGIGKGSGVPAFHVTDVTGPNATKKLCYV